MTPYVLSKLPLEDVSLFEKIRLAVSELPDLDFGKDEWGREIILSCHILTRAAGKIFGLKHVGGYFYPNYCHSWLLTPNGNIIDVYPVAILGGPIMIDGGNCSPSRRIYLTRRLRIGAGKPSFRRAVRMVERAIKNE